MKWLLKLIYDMALALIVSSLLWAMIVMAYGFMGYNS